MTKTAIVLVNLGGPDGPEAVEPFLFNLFNDPAIISLPSVFRYCLARWISWKRAPIARDIYKHLGGRSPLVDMTIDQAKALDAVLNNNSDDHEFKSFIAMRYWHPMSLEAAEKVKAYNPDSIVFLPLYPQYSTTTTGSSFAEWKKCAQAVGLRAPTCGVCCYPVEPGWIAAQCELFLETMKTVKSGTKTRVLFSAHGLPKKVIEKGDPYQFQVEKTAAALARAIADSGYNSLDCVVCYQSKVGRLEWIGPSTETEIERAAKDGVGIVIIPIAFVSEHSETLVELDIEYRELAEQAGLTNYHRVPTVQTHEKYINGLAEMVLEVLPKASHAAELAPEGRNRACPSERLQCPFFGAT